MCLMILRFLVRGQPFNNGRFPMTAPERSAIPRLLRLKNLKGLGVANSYAQLRYLQEHEGFPPGFLLGPSTRVFREPEVAAWLETRPTTQSEQTKIRAAKSLAARRARRLARITNKQNT
jgi:predicted DNA-binding transcriptional regulator AlpA